MNSAALAPSTMEAFQPAKATIGALLSVGTPVLIVPDYQRDYSWQKRHAEAFFEDILAFDKLHPSDNILGREYFLGATVLATQGSSLLILDGQQRLATSTILLSAILDRLDANGFANDAEILRRDYIVAEDPLRRGELTYRLRLNVDDQPFFSSNIQRRGVPALAASRESHKLIKANYDILTSKLVSLEQGLGVDAIKDRLLRLATVMLNHACVLQAVSASEDSASRIFITLNDRGIGLSLVDYVRSVVLQHTPASAREDVIKRWSKILEVTEKSYSREDAIRLSWISNHGDVKERRLHEAVRDEINADKTKALQISEKFLRDAQMIDEVMEGASDDEQERRDWLSIKGFRANPVIPLVLAARDKFSESDRRRITRAAVSLFVRYSVVSRKDRSALETLLFTAAVEISKGEKFSQSLARLQKATPEDAEFDSAFLRLRFTPRETHLSRTLLERLEEASRADDENDIAGSKRVHVEHVLAQNPPSVPNFHDSHLWKLGNLTLLGKKLNIGASNKDFTTKCRDYFSNSSFKITNDLCSISGPWDDKAIDARQANLLIVAKRIWPSSLA